jgi:hypothetical protein
MVPTAIKTTRVCFLLCLRAALDPTTAVVWSTPGSLPGHIWIKEARASVHPAISVKVIGGRKTDRKDRHGGRRSDTSPRPCKAADSKLWVVLDTM